MTANQIAYWGYKENQRHNLETEAFNIRNLDEIRRHNLAYETETSRHNRNVESYNRMNLAELNRHNLVTEAHNSNILAETVRSNMARESETTRSNVARETETRRSNTAAERETRRANVAKETENRRSNVARETETHRSNVTKESQSAEQLRINWTNTVVNGVESFFDVLNDTRKTSSQVVSNIANAVGKIIPILSMVG